MARPAFGPRHRRRARLTQAQGDGLRLIIEEEDKDTGYFPLCDI